MARAVLTSAPVYPWMRQRALRHRPVTVLMYHTLGDDTEDLDAWTVVRMGDFRRQMDHLRAHYDIVSLDDALARQAAGTDAPAARPLAVLTFDDGHNGLHAHLLPLVERDHLPVTVFVATGHIESGACYWFDRAMNALQTSGPWSLDMSAHGLGKYEVGHTRGAQNWERMRALLDNLKQLAPEQRERATDDLVRQATAARRPPFTPLAPLSPQQLRELAASPWVTIGAHTHGHELLDQIELQAARDTMARSRDLLQAWTGQAVRHFAYPNGNCTPALVRETAALGFASAFSTRMGLWAHGDNVHTLPRVPVGRYDDMARFRWALLGDRVFH